MHLWGKMFEHYPETVYHKFWCYETTVVISIPRGMSSRILNWMVSLSKASNRVMWWRWWEPEGTQERGLELLKGSSPDHLHRWCRPEWPLRGPHTSWRGHHCRSSELSPHYHLRNGRARLIFHFSFSCRQRPLAPSLCQNTAGEL